MTERCPPPEAAEPLCFHRDKVAKLRAALPDDAALARRARALKAVAHPGRLAVLHLVAMEECCVCDVAHTLGMPVSSVSQHLRRLQSAGLITGRQDGRFVFYSVADEARVAGLLRGPRAESAI